MGIIGLNDAVFWAMASLQVLGLAAALGTRFGNGYSRSHVSRYLFLFLMCLLGAGTIALVCSGTSQWTSPGASLCGMLLAATWGRNPHGAHLVT
jgi:hypothetical protein